MDRLIQIIVMALISVLLLSTYGVQPREEFVINHHGDLYDYVDFYKQPAFDHPLLANHSFHHEMRPSSLKPEMTPKTKISRSIVSLNETDLQFNGVSCPDGTVPIRRITEKDRIREERHFKKYGSKYNVLSAENPGTHYAIMRTKFNDFKKKYNGGGAGISVWQPSVQTTQYSSGQLVLRNGDNNIQVGWTSNPYLYGNSHTRLFIYTGAGAAVQCFNTRCPGFVVVNKNIPLDGLLTSSKPGGPTLIVQLMIYKEATDGNWWLRIGQTFTPVGFWPKEIFTGLADMATSLEWGGQAYSPLDITSPPMGSSEFIKKDTLYDAFCSHVTTINEIHQIASPGDLEPYADSSSYQVLDMGIVNENFGNLVLFGGPGGVIGN